MAYKINIDKKKCIGCGSCEAICPQSFEMKDGKAQAKKQKVDKLTCEKDAESSCPTQAITISQE